MLYTSCEINSICTSNNSVNDGAEEVGIWSALYAGRIVDTTELFLDIFQIHAHHDAFFFVAGLFDEIYNITLDGIDLFVIHLADIGLTGK